MWFWWFMLICDLLTPIIMIICGWMMWKHTPKQINGLIGYRTARSIKNMDTWNFAHNYCGRLWCKLGLIVLGLSAISSISFYKSSEDLIGVKGVIIITIQVIIIIVSIFPTEKALKRNFNEDGTKKRI